MDSTSILNSVFYISSTDEPIRGTVPSMYNLTNIGKIGLVNEPLTKSPVCDESMWSLGDDTTLFVALGKSVTDNINTYQNVREWAKDTQMSNSGFPVLTQIVGHIHDMLGETTIDYPATCQKPGQMSTKCSKCDHVTVQELPIKSHDWQTQILVAPTCTTTGQSVEVCSMCDSEQNEQEIPATGHSWQDYTLEATCTTDG